MKKVGADRESREWKEYIFFVNERIADGLTNTILHNLEVMFEYLYPEPSREKIAEPPLLLININIENFKLRLNLEFKSTNREDDTIFGLVDKWVEKFIQISTFMDRADTVMNKNTDYLQEITENTAIRAWLARIYRKVKSTEVNVTKWKNEYFSEFKELYSTSAEESFDSFLNDKGLYPPEAELRKDDEDIFKKEATEETEEETEEDNEQDNIYNIDYESEKTPKSIRDIFMGVRPRESTPKIKAFMDKLTMLKNKKQRKGLLANDTKIEFLKIEISDLRENLDTIIES
jgi:hypothetical protein